MRSWPALFVLTVLAWGMAPQMASAQASDSLNVERDSVEQTHDSLVQGQDSLVQVQDTLLAGIRKAYQQLDYEQAEQMANVLLMNQDQLTSEQLTEVRTILGVVNYSTGEEEEARHHFEAALTLTPDLRLDSTQFSPKILAFLDVVKAGMQPEEEPVQEPTVAYVAVIDPIPAAAVRSAVLPGWGQYYKGQRTKGRVLMSLWGVAASGLVVSQALYAHYANVEDEAATQEDAVDAYDRKNTWFKIRNNLALGAAGVWLYSYLDTILSDAVPTTVQLGPRTSASIQPGLSSLRLRVTF